VSRVCFWVGWFEEEGWWVWEGGILAAEWDCEWEGSGRGWIWLWDGGKDVWGEEEDESARAEFEDCSTLGEANEVGEAWAGRWDGVEDAKGNMDVWLRGALFWDVIGDWLRGFFEEEAPELSAGEKG
jgi:hypothetical protein